MSIKHLFLYTSCYCLALGTWKYVNNIYTTIKAYIHVNIGAEHISHIFMAVFVNFMKVIFKYNVSTEYSLLLDIVCQLMGFHEFLFENHLAFTWSIVMQANVE